MLTHAITSRWSEETFMATVVGAEFVMEVRGWVYRRPGARNGHVGLCIDGAGQWWLVHLQSGSRILKMEGEARGVLPLATEFAEMTDWSFRGAGGWRQTDPTLVKRIAEIWAKNPVLMPWPMPGPEFMAVADVRQAAEAKDDAELEEMVQHVEAKG